MTQKPFYDKNGCGCENVDEIKNFPEVFCKNSDRKVEKCSQVYNPVCGNFDSTKIQCITEPCGVTYDNSCLACKDEIVISYRKGECNPFSNLNS